MDWARDIKLFVGDKTAFTSDIVTAGHLTPEIAPIISIVHTNCDNISNFRFGAFSAFPGPFKVSVEVKMVV